jgi:metal-responsive CopG/Arc/MetJ family transcriptional regulator
MVKTQIYLTEEEGASIVRISKSLGHGKSEIIRQALDEFIERRDSKKRLKALQAARGMWADHESLPDLKAMRGSFDRF